MTRIVCPNAFSFFGQKKKNSFAFLIQLKVTIPTVTVSHQTVDSVQSDTKDLFKKFYFWYIINENSATGKNKKTQRWETIQRLLSNLFLF